MKRCLQPFQLPDVNVFALVNLLFPAQHAVSLSSASVPCDLVTAGQILQPLAVTPSSVALPPGGTQSFAAQLNDSSISGVTWEIDPPLGTIDTEGNYTAPAEVSGVQAVVIGAVDQSDTSNAGRALVLLYQLPPAGQSLSIDPGDVMLPQGQQFQFTVTDTSGNPVAATCEASPPGVGTLAPGFSTGTFVFRAPVNVTSPETVTIAATAENDPSQTGTATVQLIPTAAVSISPSSSTITVNQSVELTAQAEGIDEFAWAIHPTGSGRIDVPENSSAQATFCPIQGTRPNTTIMVVAYSLGNPAGIGVASVTISAQGDASNRRPASRRIIAENAIGRSPLGIGRLSLERARLIVGLGGLAAGGRAKSHDVEMTDLPTKICAGHGSLLLGNLHSIPGVSATCVVARNRGSRCLRETRRLRGRPVV